MKRLALLLGLLPGCTLTVSGEGDPATLDGLGLACPPSVDNAWAEEALGETLTLLFSAVLADSFDALTAEVEARHTGPVDSIVLTDFALLQQDPPAEPSGRNSLGFLHDVEVHVEGAETLPRELLLQAHDIGAATTELVFEPTELDIQPYVEEGFEVGLDFSVQACPAEDLTFVPTYTARVGF